MTRADNHTVWGRVLVVDDSETALEILASNLRELNWDVEMARTGVEAIERVEKRTFDAVVRDLHMPDMDGHAVMRKLRQIDETLPVVILSADCELPAVRVGRTKPR